MVTILNVPSYLLLLAFFACQLCRNAWGLGGGVVSKTQTTTPNRRATPTEPPAKLPAQLSTINLAWSSKEDNSSKVVSRRGREAAGHLISHIDLADGTVEVTINGHHQGKGKPPVTNLGSDMGGLLGPQRSTQASAGTKSLACLSAKGTALNLLDKLKAKLKSRGIM